LDWAARIRGQGSIARSFTAKNAKNAKGWLVPSDPLRSSRSLR